MTSREHGRLKAYREDGAKWKNWGPYLSERAWGTVREDYSPQGQAWEYLTHEDARSTAYRWNEDGLAGFCDRNQYLCMALALWNCQDPILKERLFGLSGHEGNHGEDVKEYYFYLDSTPTHSYCKMLYKYPQSRFPYEDLREENGGRSGEHFEYELIDTGVFEDHRYFDVFVEYAKADVDDILVRYTICNRGPEASTLSVLPTLWFRNTWSWGYPAGPMGDVPEKTRLTSGLTGSAFQEIRCSHPASGEHFWYVDGEAETLFTENETAGQNQFAKDAFHRYVVDGQQQSVNPAREGTKASALVEFSVPAGGSRTVCCRLCARARKAPFDRFSEVFATRIQEADEFYAAIRKPGLSDDEQTVQRQAFAGLLWSKQFYYYDVEQWLHGEGRRETGERRSDRNSSWNHLSNFDIISMPDKWEYPWYASWDLAFHCLPLALVDPDFAKRQLKLLTREWYMHPNGQLPAYEWDFNDVNPPVHAWAVWRVYQIDRELHGRGDRAFLEEMFHKLLMNFTWWVNRKDHQGRNIFQGGFLGLDNISIFNRSVPEHGRIDQADATAWVGAFCLTLMQIALELAGEM